MLWRFLEAIVLVEVFCRLMKGVYEQRPDTGVLRNAQRTTNCVLQQGGPNFDTLESLVNRQSAQNQHRYRIRHVAANAAGCRLV